uniref:Mitochondrial GTPase 1 n=1 Tax=Paulinella chromatophora TaxID=39717 RepID=B1X4C2_PAUCH|nr:hypothetical protein PCC_0350 [Paulinella chromatophora]ACB42791.1 hypothetical protein PCC_0350 [Paulinella chromatophora]
MIFDVQSKQSSPESTSPIIQWYPGHIAKAERQLFSSLDKVDLVIEVRDARVPFSSGYPDLKKWFLDKQYLLVINRQDMISESAMKCWDWWLRSIGEAPLWCNARIGTGVKQLQLVAIQAGDIINERRQNRGMKPRRVRAIVLGFPNVGKSALINRLVRKKIAVSARRAGITRSLNWIRVSEELDLLDSPGVLPPKLEDQRGALLLAICDNIGEASYNKEEVAIGLLQVLQQLSVIPEIGLSINSLGKRYVLDIPVSTVGSMNWLKIAANHHTSGNVTRMAQRLLDDFRRSNLGSIALELPPISLFPKPE